MIADADDEVLLAICGNGYTVVTGKSDIWLVVVGLSPVRGWQERAASTSVQQEMGACYWVIQKECTDATGSCHNRWRLPYKFFLATGNCVCSSSCLGRTWYENSRGCQ